MSSHSSCSDNADVPSHDSQYCLVQRVLLPCISDSGKIPARHPSVLCLFCSYAQLTDGCSFFPLTRTSLHQLMESYQSTEIIPLYLNSIFSSSHTKKCFLQRSSCG